MYRVTLCSALFSAALMIFPPMVHAQFLYWSDDADNTIKRAPIDGTGTIETLISTVGTVGGLAVDASGGYIYYADNTESQIWRARLDGSSAQMLYDVGIVSTPRGIALDPSNSHIYWLNNQQLRRGNFTGGSFETLRESMNYLPFEISIDPTNNRLYWSGFSQGRISRIDLDGMNASDPLITLPNNQALGTDTDSSFVYWVEFGNGILRRATLSGTGATTISSTGLDGPRTMVVDESNAVIYVANFNTENFCSMPLSGGACTEIRSGVGTAGFMDIGPGGVVPVSLSQFAVE